MALTLSYSQISTYQNCPKHYWYRYIERLPGRMWKSASFGTSIHNALYSFFNVILEQRNNRQVSLFEESKKELPTLLDLYRFLDEAWVSGGYENKTEEYSCKKDALRLMETWYMLNKDNFGNPLYLETSFKVPIGNITLSGRFDRIDTLPNGNVEIIDYKTGMEKDQAGVDQDLQLSIYAKAATEILHLNVEKLCLYYVGKNKKIYTVRDHISLGEMEKTVIGIAKRIEEEEWEASPGDVCTWCDYNQICEQSAVGSNNLFT